MIESGHFRFHVVGDRILHVDARLFYKHRGLERAAEGATLADGLRRTSRAPARRCCGHERGRLRTGLSRTRSGSAATRELRARAHGPARARAPLQPPQRHRRRLRRRRLRRRRRPASPRCKERARRLNAALDRAPLPVRHPSRSAAANSTSTTSAARGRARATLARDSRATRHAAWRELLFNGSFMDRLPDIGDRRRAGRAALGCVGPAARAAGVADDVRATARGSPTTASSRHRSDAPPATSRRVSSSAPSSSCRRLDLLDAPARRPVRPGDGRAATAAEPRDRRRPRREPARRDHAASSSATATASAGSGCAPARTRTGPQSPTPQPSNLLPDFPLINKSFELCYACVDR